MIGQIDGHYVAAQIRFIRQVHKGTVLIVEGDTDARVFQRFIDSSSCDVEVAFGKKNVLGALDLLEDEGFQGVLAVIDADFDRISGESYALENLFMTDKHDLDLTIFCSPALGYYIAEHADDGLVKSHFKNDLDAIREKVVLASLPIAYCRYVSEMHNLRLYFRDLKYESFVSDDSLAVDEDALLNDLIDRSVTGCTVPRLTLLIQRERSQNHDRYQLTNGHDVAAILGISLRKILAHKRVPQTWASEIESGLRLACDREALQSTRLYDDLKKWEGERPKYKIF